MKTALCFAALFVLSIFLSGCAVAHTQQTPVDTTDIGVFVFQDATTFEPHLCVQFDQEDATVAAFSLITANWNHDSAPAAALSYLSVKAEAGAGHRYFDVCNVSEEPITVPAAATINYEVFNFNGGGA